MRSVRVIGRAVLLFLGVAACHRDSLVPATSRYTSFSNACLATQFYKARSSNEERPFFHLLFVPVVAPTPRSGFGWSGGSGGTVDELKFDYTYHGFDESSRDVIIRSHPIYVRNLVTVEADGQSFALAKGSVFVAHVNLDGSLRMVQLPIVARDHDPAPAAVLEAIKRHAPSDKRLQDLPSR